MRTLVISDLHLGNRRRHDVLRLPEIRERLFAALDGAGAERLVLLGDILELMHRQPRRSMDPAEPVLREIGRVVGADREVIIVPGNHDAPLVRSWALARGAELQTSHDVPVTASPALERLTSWLGPARVRVSYPGVWLGDGIWATHGHYLDHYLVPDSAFGALRRSRHEAGARTSPMAYERLHQRSGRSRESLADRILARPLATLLQSLIDPLRLIPRLLLKSRMAPVTAKLLDIQMRHAAMPAMARVVHRLGVEADWVLFGHVHRRGPIGAEAWPSGGGPRMLNTGAWLYEPLLVDRASAPHPYWPGGAVLLDDGKPPRSLGLLDDLAAEQFQVPPLGAISAG